MNEEIKSDWGVVIDFFKGLQRQGPGSEKQTLKALSFIPNLEDNSLIADIGCGTGSQTIVLAKNIKGRIIAVDLIPEMIDILNEKIKVNYLGHRISTLTQSMDHLSFFNDELDLIWAEGAIYILGFERGLNEWRKFLKLGGYIAVSEISWLTNNRPTEIEDFWVENYSEINTIDKKIEQLKLAGYKYITHFVFPENCWVENYYDQIIESLNDFISKNGYMEVAQQFLKHQKKEIEMYNKYKEYYGYVFYIGQKI